MAMSINDTTARQEPATRRGQTKKAVVPPTSREATARKLEPAETEELDRPEPAATRPSAKTRPNPEAEARRKEILQKISELEEKRDAYVERLDVGAAKIEEARAQGKDVTMWEDYWIQLLRRYEAVCDSLRELHNSI